MSGRDGLVSRSALSLERRDALPDRDHHFADSFSSDSSRRGWRRVADAAIMPSMLREYDAGNQACRRVQATKRRPRNRSGYD
jgi:hypothetical protein